MALEAFLGLEENADIDDRIRAKESELDAVRQAEQIRTRATPSALTMPALPANCVELLARAVDGIAEDAEAQVTAQIEAHAMHDRGQAWLSEGVRYVRDERCPFCDQVLAPATALIGAYRAFFGQGYADLRTTIVAMRTSLDDALGERQIASLEKTAEQNVAAVEFWSRFCDITAPVLPADAGQRLRTLRESAVALLNHKAAAPLEAIVPDSAFTDAMAQVALLTDAVTIYNEAIAAANTTIATQKAATGATDITTIEAALVSLRLTKKTSRTRSQDRLRKVSGRCCGEGKNRGTEGGRQGQARQAHEDCPWQIRADDQSPALRLPCRFQYHEDRARLSWRRR